MRSLVISLLCAISMVGVTASASVAQQKTAKACRDEWRAAKADFQAKGITEKAYVDQCRRGTAANAPQAPAPAPTAAPAPAPQRPTAAPPPRPAPSATAAPTAQGQYASEAEAKGHCVGDQVVWVNLVSRIYHYSGTRNYGTTKRGAYMCERNATAQGMRASKTEKRPGA